MKLKTGLIATIGILAGIGLSYVQIAKAVAVTFAAQTQTTQNTIYYVGPSGNDSNDCVNTGTPCLTRVGAYGKIPSRVIHAITVQSQTGDVSACPTDTRNLILETNGSITFLDPNSVVICTNVKPELSINHGGTLYNVCDLSGNCGSGSYVNQYDCDYSAQSSVTFNSDGNQTFCGASCRVMNTANSSPTPRITNGSGFVVTPTGGNYSATTRTAPLMACPLTNLVPGLTFRQGFRVYAYVASNGADGTHNIAAISALEVPATVAGGVDITCTTCGKFTYMRKYQNFVTTAVQWGASWQWVANGDIGINGWGCNACASCTCNNMNYAVWAWDRGLQKMEEDWYLDTYSSGFRTAPNWSPVVTTKYFTDSNGAQNVSWGLYNLSQSQPIHVENPANWNIVLGAQLSSGSSAAVTWGRLRVDTLPAPAN